MIPADRLRRWLTPDDERLATRTVSGSDDRARLFAALTVVTVGAVGWNLVGNLVLPGAWYVPANLIVGLAAVATARWAGLDAGELGMGRAQLGRGLGHGAVAMGLVAVVLGIGLLLPGLDAWFADDVVADDSTPERWFVALVRIPLGTAVFEELLFRSAVIGLLARWRGVGAALLGSSVLFGLWHVVPAWEGSSGPLPGLIASVAGIVVVTTVAGLLFGVLRLRSGSVVAPMMAHTATNSFAYVAAILTIDGVT